MNRLPIDTFPERGTLVVREGVEERLAERGVGVHVEGLFVPVVAGIVVVIWWGVRPSLGAVVAVTVVVVMAVGVSGALRRG